MNIPVNLVLNGIPKSEHRYVVLLFSINFNVGFAVTQRTRFFTRCFHHVHQM